jgi:glycosyltransferase involved in cell wall biosynthesis
MNYLINLYNQVGAGPKNISLNLISELRKALSTDREYYVIVPVYGEYRALASAPGLTLIRLPRHESLWMKMLYRIYLDFLLLPQLVKRHGIGSVLAFGNFLIAPLNAKKTVLLHHPYIFDDRQLTRLPFSARCVERIKRVVFDLTLRNDDQVVVQSEYVKESLRAKWPWFRGAVSVIENPVSNRFDVCTDAEVVRLVAKRKASMDEWVELFYVSRFYPHKNHRFLIPLSKALIARGLCHQILVTINPDISGARALLDEVMASGLPIVNLGEVDQAVLQRYYASAHFFLFPSEAETFGNPLVEALGFALPVIAPDLEYAHAVLGDVGQYYSEDDADDCADKILLLIQDADRYETICRDGRQRFSRFPRADEWLRKYLALI